MEHRGYTGTVEYDAVERFFYGRVLDIQDSIYYEAVSEERLECAFRDSVDEYLDQCWACEQEPERPRAGAREQVDGHASIETRAGPELISGPASDRLARAPSLAPA